MITQYKKPITIIALILAAGYSFIGDFPYVLEYTKHLVLVSSCLALIIFMMEFKEQQQQDIIEQSPRRTFPRFDENKIEIKQHKDVFSEFEVLKK